MFISYLKSAQKARAAARNYRILSALDDDMLHDIGLDRRTLRAFCDNGCAHTTAPVVNEAVNPLAILLRQTLRPALR